LIQTAPRFKHSSLGARTWEFAAGLGHIVDDLRRAGYSVYASDIGQTQ
jgi:hypothetical protein